MWAGDPSLLGHCTQKQSPHRPPRPASPRLPVSLHSLRGRREAQGSHCPPGLSVLLVLWGEGLTPQPRSGPFTIPSCAPSTLSATSHLPPARHSPSLEAPGLRLDSQQPASAVPEKTAIHPSAASSSDGFPPRRPITHASSVLAHTLQFRQAPKLRLWWSPHTGGSRGLDSSSYQQHWPLLPFLFMGDAVSRDRCNSHLQLYQGPSQC